MKFYKSIIIIFIAVILFLAIYPPIHSEAQTQKLSRKKPLIERLISILKQKSDSLSKQNEAKVEELDQNKKEFDSLKIIIKKRKNGSE